MKSRSGMTLVELVMAAALSLLLLSGMLSLLRVGRAFFLSALDESALVDCTYRIPRDIVERLSLSRADSVSPGNYTFQFATAYSEGGVFQRQSDGRPAWQGQEVYRLLNHQLYRGNHLLTGNLAAIRLWPGQNGSFELALEIDYQGYTRSFRGEVKYWATPVN